MDRQVAASEDEALTLAAGEWLLELQDRDLEVERILAWQAWMAEDPRHQQAFDRLQQIQECIDRIESIPWPTDREVADDLASDRALDAHSHGTGAALPIRQDRRTRRWSWVGALAAGVAALAIAISIVAPRAGLDLKASIGLGDPAIETAVGELRRVQLSDGSSMTLGGLSRAFIRMSETNRTIVLARGEAFFQVAKDPLRPFIVEVDGTAIRAVGTAFDVRRAGSQIMVSVAEGIVDVIEPSPQSGSSTPERALQAVTRLHAGQSIQFDPASIQPPPPVAIEPEAVAAWRNGQRQYLAEPLANVVADLNRYSTRHIGIEDPELSELAITGAIFERDIDRWLKSLEVALPVQVDEKDGEITIRRRR